MKWRRKGIQEVIKEALELEGISLAKLGLLIDPTGKTSASCVWRWKEGRVAPCSGTERVIRLVVGRLLKQK